MTSKDGRSKIIFYKLRSKWATPLHNKLWMLQLPILTIPLHKIKTTPINICSLQFNFDQILISNSLHNFISYVHIVFNIVASHKVSLIKLETKIAGIVIKIWYQISLLIIFIFFHFLIFMFYMWWKFEVSELISCVKMLKDFGKFWIYWFNFETPHRSRMLQEVVTSDAKPSTLCKKFKNLI